MAPSIMNRTLAAIMSTAVLMSGTTVASATTENPYSEEYAAELAHFTPDQIEEIQKAAVLMEKLDNASTSEEQERIFYEELGEDEANEAAQFIGLTPTELFSNETTTSGTGFRGVGEFLTCMKDEAADDLKTIFDINVVSALIGQKQYMEAAKEAVKYLAKQGVKRNAAGIAAALAFYAGKCAIFDAGGEEVEENPEDAAEEA